VSDQGDRGHAADGDRERDAELVVPQVTAGGADREREPPRNTQRVAVVHAHADQQLRRAVGLHRDVPQVVVLEQ
jgi:hypothetical protein